MLTRELLRAQVKGKTLRPAWVDAADPELQARAAELLAVLDEAAASRWTRGEVDEALREVEGDDPRLMLIRGLSKVLTDPCTFAIDCPIDPAALRDRVFRLAAARGPLARRPGPRPVAADILAEVAAELPLPEGRGAPWTPDELAEALYADDKQAWRLTERDGPDDPEVLLHRYNVALVQGMLLRATHLQVELQAPEPKRLRHLLHRLKFHQLMFRATQAGDRLHLHIDGPQSLLQQSTRYGLALATFFPALPLLPGPWTATAEVLWGARNLKKTLQVSDADGLRSHLSPKGAWTSTAEAALRERWPRLDSGWALHPGGLVPAGGQAVLAPDLAFRKDGRVAWLDIAGFWRRSWLQAAAEGCPPGVLFAVSRRLVGDKGDELPAALRERVLPFAEIIPAPELLRRIEAVAIPDPHPPEP